MTNQAIEAMSESLKIHGSRATRGRDPRHLFVDERDRGQGRGDGFGWRDRDGWKIGFGSGVGDDRGRFLGLAEDESSPAAHAFHPCSGRNVARRRADLAAMRALELRSHRQGPSTTDETDRSDPIEWTRTDGRFPGRRSIIALRYPRWRDTAGNVKADWGRPFRPFDHPMLPAGLADASLARPDHDATTSERRTTFRPPTLRKSASLVTNIEAPQWSAVAAWIESVCSWKVPRGAVPPYQDLAVDGSATQANGFE